jgi:hypothetical protein
MKKRLFYSVTALASILALASCESDVQRYCFTVSERTPVAGNRVSFNADCSEGIDLYHWNFGDGKDTITRSSTVYHVYDFPGSYQISLHGTNPAIASHCPPDAGANGARQTIEVK